MAQAAHFLVQLGPRLGGTSYARAQFLDLLGVRARHAQQPLGLALAFGQPGAQLGQGGVGRLVAAARGGPLGRRGAVPFPRRDLHQSVAKGVRLVGATKGDVVGRLLGLALRQLGLDPQIHGGLVEFRDAIGRERGLAEHAHRREVRRQGIDGVVVGNAVATITVGDDAGKPAAGRHQRQQRGKLDGAATA